MGFYSIVLVLYLGIGKIFVGTKQSAFKLNTSTSLGVDAERSRSVKQNLPSGN